MFYILLVYDLITIGRSQKRKTKETELRKPKKEKTAAPTTQKSNIDYNNYAVIIELYRERKR